MRPNYSHQPIAFIKVLWLDPKRPTNWFRCLQFFNYILSAKAHREKKKKREENVTNIAPRRNEIKMFVADDVRFVRRK